MHQLSLALLSLAFGAASICSAASITYNVNQTIGAGGVTGDIVTDGTIGALDLDTNIVDWNLLLNDGTATFELLGPLQSGGNSILLFHTGAGDLSATATQLLFDFSGSGQNFFYFDWNINSGTPGLSQAVLCFQSAPDTCSAGLSSGELIQLSGDFFAPGYNDTGSNNQFTGVSGTQVIGTTNSSASITEPSTLALLGAGMALLRFRKPRSK